MSAGWSRGTDIARHEYKGLSKMSYGLEDWVEKDRQEALEISRRAMRLATLLGHHESERGE
jgi:WD repeat-containing protein 23